MPRGDRTGPWGQGPMTGRAAGFCAGFRVPGFMNPASWFGRGRGIGYGRGQGFGRGRGRGMGWGQGWWGAAGVPGVDPYFTAPYAGPATDSRTELEALKEEAAGLEGALENIRSRIEELESQSGKQ